MIEVAVLHPLLAAGGVDPGKLGHKDLGVGFTLGLLGTGYRPGAHHNPGLVPNPRGKVRQIFPERGLSPVKFVDRPAHLGFRAFGQQIGCGGALRHQNMLLYRVGQKPHLGIAPRQELRLGNVGVVGDLKLEGANARQRLRAHSAIDVALIVWLLRTGGFLQLQQGLHERHVVYQILAVLADAVTGHERVIVQGLGVCKLQAECRHG